MHIELISFGKLTDVITGSSLDIPVKTTGQLRKYLEGRFPELKEMKYLLAMDNKLVQQDTELISDARIAIMPPFSGG